MNARRWVQLSVMAVLLGVSMSGCGGGVFNTEPSADWGKRPDGREILLDTDRNWRDWREGIDSAIRTEKAEMKALGFPDWGVFWNREISRIEATRENAPKHIAYIIESRRRADLPELEGYPLPAGD